MATAYHAATSGHGWRCLAAATHRPNLVVGQLDTAAPDMTSCSRIGPCSHRKDNFYFFVARPQNRLFCFFAARPDLATVNQIRLLQIGSGFPWLNLIGRRSSLAIAGWTWPTAAKSGRS